CSDSRLDENYNLDACGNRQDGACDPSNRLLSQGARKFSYDARGHQIAEVGPRSRTFEVDARGRLTRVHEAGALIEYDYDPLGRRIAKRVNGVTTRFIWAGTQLLSESVDDGQKATRRDYMFCPEFMTPLAFRDGAATFCVHSGRLQEPLCVTD